MKRVVSFQVCKKYLLSFLKRKWKVADYPVIIEHHPVVVEAGKWRTFPWTAKIANWDEIIGLGDSKAEALAVLEKNFLEYQADEKTPPRPGTRRATVLRMAPTYEIDGYSDLSREFFRKILNSRREGYFLSDKTSIWDICFDREEKIFQKIMDVYGVDISDIPDGSLISIFRRIEESRHRKDSSGT